MDRCAQQDREPHPQVQVSIHVPWKNTFTYVVFPCFCRQEKDKVLASRGSPSRWRYFEKIHAFLSTKIRLKSIKAEEDEGEHYETLFLLHSKLQQSLQTNLNNPLETGPCSSRTTRPSCSILLGNNCESRGRSRYLTGSTEGPN